VAFFGDHSCPEVLDKRRLQLVKVSQNSRVTVRNALSRRREDYGYSKSRIMLGEPTDEREVHDDLSQRPSPESARSEHLTVIIDEINRKTLATVYIAREAGPAVYAMHSGQ
jgi:DNA polymerase V